MKPKTDTATPAMAEPASQAKIPIPELPGGAGAYTLLMRGGFRVRMEMIDGCVGLSPTFLAPPGVTIAQIREVFMAAGNAIHARDFDPRFRDLLGKLDLAEYYRLIKLAYDEPDPDPRAQGEALTVLQPVDKAARSDCLRIYGIASGAAAAHDKVVGREMAEPATFGMVALLGRLLLADALENGGDVRADRQLCAGILCQMRLPNAIELLPLPAPPPTPPKPKGPDTPAAKPEEPFIGGVRTITPEGLQPGVHVVRSGDPR